MGIIYPDKNEIVHLHKISIDTVKGYKLLELYEKFKFKIKIIF